MTNIFKAAFNPAVMCQVKGLVDIYWDYFGNKPKGYFVEVGAFNCFNWSNTLVLADMGWEGLYIEPLPKHMLECVSRFKDNPRIQLYEAAIGNRTGQTRLYIGGSLTTTKLDTVRAYSDISWSSFVDIDEDVFIHCKLRTLNYTLNKFNVPVGFDVLVIDVEGSEEDVMEGFSLDLWKPKMAIVKPMKQTATPA